MTLIACECPCVNLIMHQYMWCSVKQQGDFGRFNPGNGGRIVKGVINNRLGLLLWWSSMWTLRWDEAVDGCKSYFWLSNQNISNIWNHLQMMTKSPCLMLGWKLPWALDSACLKMIKNEHTSRINEDPGVNKNRVFSFLNSTDFCGREMLTSFGLFKKCKHFWGVFN